MQTYKHIIDVSLLLLVTSGVFLILLIIIGTPGIIAKTFRLLQVGNTARA